MDALTRRADLLDVDVPRAVWARGKRPWRGTLIRVGVAAGLLVMALVIPVLGVRIALAVLGVAVLMFTTPVTDRRLAQLETRVRGADRSQAARLLVGIERAPLVDLFATHAWVALQKGRLNLVLGNGRAAARAFADAGKYADDANNAALASAQVHAHVLAGDRKDARVILATLEEKQLLTARDRLDYGLVLLDESGRTAVARAHLEAAREALGGHPRVLAALALAYARGDDGSKALEMLRIAEESEDVADDEIATELLRRARKAARTVLEAEEKRSRRAKPSADASTSDAARPGAAKPSKKEKKEKKDRRKERREKRKADRDTRGDAAPVDVQARAEAEQRGVEKRAAVERHEAEERARAEREAADKRAEAERRAEAMKRAEAETHAAEQRAAEQRALEQREAEKREAEKREAEKREAEKREAEKREAEKREAERLAEAKKRADDELEAAARDAAARTQAERQPPKPAAPPVFAPPPLPIVPDVPKAPNVSPPPVLSAPVVPKVDSAPAVDADGWDDLLGDAPAPKPKT